MSLTLYIVTTDSLLKSIWSMSWNSILIRSTCSSPRTSRLQSLWKHRPSITDSFHYMRTVRNLQNIRIGYVHLIAKLKASFIQIVFRFPSNAHFMETPLVHFFCSSFPFTHALRPSWTAGWLVMISLIVICTPVKMVCSQHPHQLLHSHWRKKGTVLLFLESENSRQSSQSWPKVCCDTTSKREDVTVRAATLLK